MQLNNCRTLRMQLKFRSIKRPFKMSLHSYKFFRGCDWLLPVNLYLYKRSLRAVKRISNIFNLSPDQLPPQTSVPRRSKQASSTISGIIAAEKGQELTFLFLSCRHPARQPSSLYKFPWMSHQSVPLDTIFVSSRRPFSLTYLFCLAEKTEA